MRVRWKLAATLGLMVVSLVAATYASTAVADTGAAQGKAMAPSRPGVLKAGPTRTDEEIVQCRKEEYARSRGEGGGEVQAPAEPVKLRSTPRKLSVKECDAQSRKWNFWSEENEAKGCFVNAFVYRQGSSRIWAPACCGELDCPTSTATRRPRRM